MPAHDDAAARHAAGPQDTEIGLHVEVRPGTDHNVVRISGDLDIETLAPAREAFERAFWDIQVVVADLEGVTFCDSSGLNLLLQTRADALAAGAQLRLAAISPPVRRLLEITGAQAAFDVHPTVGAALAEIP
ncbi:STAS domain-containing protein [Kitasatospora sp. NPDC101801]|uniref:STAS domain-containing protein n=1 Tax=Kitasatospora sp. NPDC101801 TaxID=3364103 RepID=UPI003816CDEA